VDTVFEGVLLTSVDDQGFGQAHGFPNSLISFSGESRVAERLDLGTAIVVVSIGRC
jgi:hypothetical protein